MGNVFNVADMSPVKEFMHQLPSGMGKVKLYIVLIQNFWISLKMHPAMTAEAAISDTIQPVLEALANSYFPVKGMSFYQTLDIYSLFSDKKLHIYIHNNGYWIVKGHFKKALAKYSKIAWDMEDSVSILVVISFILLL